MSWVSLEDDFHSNPKLVDVGLDGTGLFARALSFCGDFLTDGFISTEQMLRLADRRKKVIAKCVTFKLFTEEEGGYRIPDYLELNPSREWVLNRRAELAAAGKKGAKKRWEKKPSQKPPEPSPGHDPGDSPGHDPGVADPIAERWLTTPAPYPTGEKAEEGSSNGRSEVKDERATPNFETDNSLVPESELAMLKLASEVRGVENVQTQVNVIRSLYGGKLPAAAFYSALEKTLKTREKHIGYAMGTLRSMVEEHQYG